MCGNSGYFKNLLFRKASKSYYRTVYIITLNIWFILVCTTELFTSVRWIFDSLSSVLQNCLHQYVEYLIHCRVYYRTVYISTLNIWFIVECTKELFTSARWIFDSLSSLLQNCLHQYVEYLIQSRVYYRTVYISTLNIWFIVECTTELFTSVRWIFDSI